MLPFFPLFRIPARRERLDSRKWKMLIFISAVLLNVAPRGKLADEAREALEGKGITVLPSTIHQRAAYSHAVIDGRAVHEYEPEGKAAEDIAGIYGNISRKLGLHTGRRKVVA